MIFIKFDSACEAVMYASCATLSSSYTCVPGGKNGSLTDKTWAWIHSNRRDDSSRLFTLAMLSRDSLSLILFLAFSRLSKKRKSLLTCSISLENSRMLRLGQAVIDPNPNTTSSSFWETEYILKGLFPFGRGVLKFSFGLFPVNGIGIRASNSSEIGRTPSSKND